MQRLLLALIFVLLCTWPAQAQVVVQQSAIHADACTQESTATSAGNVVSTVTLTPPAGQFVYVCSIYIVETANALVTAAAGPLPIFTTTNLQTNLVYWGDNSALTAGQLVKIKDMQFGYPLKTAQPGVAFTMASSGGGQSTYNTRMSVAGYFAP
jgi:hypothetical protein